MFGTRPCPPCSSSSQPQIWSLFQDAGPLVLRQDRGEPPTLHRLHSWPPAPAGDGPWVLPEPGKQLCWDGAQRQVPDRCRPAQVGVRGEGPLALEGTSAALRDSQARALRPPRQGSGPGRGEGSGLGLGPGAWGLLWGLGPRRPQLFQGASVRVVREAGRAAGGCVLTNPRPHRPGPAGHTLGTPCRPCSSGAGEVASPSPRPLVGTGGPAPHVVVGGWSDFCL